MRRLTMQLAGLHCLCLLAGPASAQNAPFFVGKWYVEDVKVCRSKPGNAEGLLTYTGTKMFGYESRCDIARKTPKGPAIELHMNCSGEGETYKQRDLVELTPGNKLKVTGTAEGRTFSFTYRRCP